MQRYRKDEMKTKGKFAAVVLMAIGSLFAESAIAQVPCVPACATGYMCCNGKDKVGTTHNWCCPTANGGYCGGWVEATPSEGAHGACHSTNA